MTIGGEHAGEEGVRQTYNAVFFATLVLALVPFTYMCAVPAPSMQGINLLLQKHSLHVAPGMLWSTQPDVAPGTNPQLIGTVLLVATGYACSGFNKSSASLDEGFPPIFCLSLFPKMRTIVSASRPSEACHLCGRPPDQSHSEAACVKLPGCVLKPEQMPECIAEGSFLCRSMFVSDRSFFMRDPARSLYSTAAYYLSVMTVNAAVTIINAAILLLLMYSMIGEPSKPFQAVHARGGRPPSCCIPEMQLLKQHFPSSSGELAGGQRSLSSCCNPPRSMS